MTEQHIDLEEIAAFVDGRLSGERRERMVRLLAESQEAYEVFAETIRFQDEQESKGGRVFPFPPWRVWVPLAAAAAIVLIVGVRSAAPPGAPSEVAPSSVELATQLAQRAGLATALGQDWDQRAWSVTRGGPVRLVEPELAFRLGVRAVDLEVALALGETETADRLIAEMLDWLGGVEMSQAVAARYAELRARLAAEPPTQLATGASAAERDLEGLLATPRFALGKWAGAAELAVRARDRSFFTSRPTRDLFEAVRQYQLDDADVDALRQIADLTRGDLGDAEYQELQAVLREIIRRNAG